MQLRRYLAPVVLATAMVPSLVAPAAAQVDDSEELLQERLVTDAVYALIDEIWLSVRLGLVDPVALGPARPIADLALYDPEESRREDLADLLEGAEYFAEDLLDDADTAGLGLPEELEEALEYQGLEPRDPALLSTAVLQALRLDDETVDDLIDTFGLLEENSAPTQAGVGPSAPGAGLTTDGLTNDGPTTEIPAATSDSDPAVTGTIEAVAASDGSGGTTPLLLVGAVAIVAMALGAGWASRRRRPTPAPTQSGGDLSDLVVQAGRELTAALDLDQVVAAAADAVVRTTGAVSARIADPSDQAEPVRAAVATGSAHSRVVDGRTVIAVPCVGDGRVLGVLVAVDPGRTDATQVLTGLASFVGPALAAADRHGSAVDIDGLTQTFNRSRLDRDLTRTVVPGRLVTMAMIDIDHFKGFNDTHGHAAGDAVLRSVAATMRANLRPGDVVYRYGGEEFSLLLVDTSTEEAAEVCERVRAAVEATEVRHDGVLLPRVTISIGVAATDAGRVDELGQSADRALYDAKGSGRNKVLVAATEDGSSLRRW